KQTTRSGETRQAESACSPRIPRRSMELDSGTTAWVLASSALVLLMTPGLAFFYGGMTRSKSVLNMMMMSFGAMGVVGVVYVLWGWSMSFGSSDVGTLFANPFELFGLKDVPNTSLVFV